MTLHHRSDGIDATERAREAVFVRTSNSKSPEDDESPVVVIKGFDFDTFRPQDADCFEGFVQALGTTGFQATNLHLAAQEIRRMLEGRFEADGSLRETRTRIFLGYTSNLVSSGLRDGFRYLCQNRLVDCVVSTAGGVEEDLIKCLAPTHLGSFDQQSGQQLRARGINRIGNLYVPNDNYCRFEEWLMPLLDEMTSMQSIWTPSQMISFLGSRINDDRSIYHWACKHDIPVFCPALTDGSLGDMLYFHSFRSQRPLVLDILADLTSINGLAVHAPTKTGAVILGGGLVKHHILNANLMRNGADHAVLVNTAGEFDGSDAGARPDEAVSWGKLRPEAPAVKVCCDATLAFPLLMAAAFVPYVLEQIINK
jgi:deoxyhypusine synthase